MENDLLNLTELIKENNHLYMVEFESLIFENSSMSLNMGTSDFIIISCKDIIIPFSKINIENHNMQIYVLFDNNDDYTFEINNYKNLCKIIKNEKLNIFIFGKEFFVERNNNIYVSCNKLKLFMLLSKLKQN